MTFNRTKRTFAGLSSAGFTLTESLIAISLLSMLSMGTFSAIPMIHYRSISTGTRSSAVMAMEGSLEALRGVGYEELSSMQTWNGLAAQNIGEVWGYDAVAGGDLPAIISLRRGFAVDAATGDWVETPESSIVGTQECFIITAGTAAGKSEALLRAVVTCRWNYRGRAFEESLYTIIEH